MDGASLELAFSKKKIEERKAWLQGFQPGTYLDMRQERITYSDFVNQARWPRWGVARRTWECRGRAQRAVGQAIAERSLALAWGRLYRYAQEQRLAWCAWLAACTGPGPSRQSAGRSCWQRSGGLYQADHAQQMLGRLLLHPLQR